MLTAMTIKNFKLFEEVTIELGERVVFIGPNNSGKTTALQAIALWDIGAKRWLEKRGGAEVPKKRPGVTINRRDLIALPVPDANLLWRGLSVRRGATKDGRPHTENVLIKVGVKGVAPEGSWECRLEFDYANEESFYCRPVILGSGERMTVPDHLADQRVAYLPPMSGLAANETRLDEGAIQVRLGEGRTAEVLRNLCWQVLERDKSRELWDKLVSRMSRLFGVDIEKPEYVRERGEIVMGFRQRDLFLDLSSSGRGQQQTLLLLAHMATNPGAILLLDEPDAHLELLRQRQIYSTLSESAAETGCQIIAASHSEVILNEAAGRDTVIAFVGSPHPIVDRGSQVAKALTEIGFEDYYQAEETGWVLYLEGPSDLAFLQAFARRLEHPAEVILERPYVHYVANQARKAQEHFHALREAKSDLAGIAIYDRLEKAVPKDSYLAQFTWSRREIENYVCQKPTLLAYAFAEGNKQGDLFATTFQSAMERAIAKTEAALKTLNKPSPWESDIKASDDFLDPLFKNYSSELQLPNLMLKSNYHVLVSHVPVETLHSDVVDMLDRIVKVANQATPRTN